MEALANDYDAELAMLNDEIRRHQVQIDMLKARRHKVYEKIDAVDMDIALQCIVENGLTSNDVIRLINNYASAQK